MENIERTQFVVLTGHLDDQPLPDLIRTLRVQRKSGRLQVEYADAPGAFFFEDGQLVDARLGTLSGVEAVYAALSLGGASFNFNPLVRPPERNIDRQEQKFISDLVARREGLPEIRLAGTTATPAPQLVQAPHESAALQLAPAHAELIAPLEERLTAVEAAIIDTSRRISRERLVYAVVISFLVGLTIVMAVQAIFNPFPADPSPAPAAARPAQRLDAAAVAPGAETARSLTSGTEAPQPPANAEAARPGTTAAPPVKKELEGAERVERVRGDAASEASTVATKKSERMTEQAQSPRQAPTAAKDARKTAVASTTRGAQVVQVLVQIKDGRVTEARVLNSRPGASASEAQALAEARGRRYLNKFTGGEILSIRVKP